MELSSVFNPRSVAVVGASKNPLKVGYNIVKNLKDRGYRGKVFCVNPKYDEVLGYKCYPSLESLPSIVDSAVIAIPSHSVLDVIEKGHKKARSFVVISGGFGEVGNYDLERKFKELGKRINKPIVGPNCLGIINNRIGYDTVFFPLHKMERGVVGNISIVSQSGGIATTLLSSLYEEGIGVDMFVSYGNAYFLDESDFLNYLFKKEGVVVLYIEGVKNGKKFLKVLEKFNKKRKPLIVLKGGKLKKSESAVSTHTASISGEYGAYRALFRKFNVIEANSFYELIDLIKISSLPLLNGNRVGIITNGGGLGILSVDAMKDMELASLSKSTIERLRSFLPHYAHPSNPLDVIADADSERYFLALDAFVKDENIDVIVVNVLFQSPFIDETLIKPLLWASSKKPLVVVSPGGGDVEPYRVMLMKAGLPVFDSPERAINALHKWWLYGSSFQKGFCSWDQ